MILSGLYHGETLTSNITINFYAKCNLLDHARKVFDGMPLKTIVSWNTMISCHTSRGEHTQALNLLLEMHRQGSSPSEFTLSSLLRACAEKSALFESRQLHCLALKASMDSNLFVGTALLDVYSKCKMIADSFQVFDDLPVKSPVSWSSMVAGYLRNDLHEKALSLVLISQQKGLEWTKFTLSAALSACAGLAAAIEGSQLHSIIIRTGLGSNAFVSTSLIDLYAKCGSIKEAWSAFSETQEKSIAVWNAMIAGFSRHARCLETTMLFQKMRLWGISPNEVTYASVLSAFSHTGSVESCRLYFDLMRREGEVEPNSLHYACMVDVLGRSGRTEEARELIERMPFAPSTSMWGSLLGSCRVHGDVELAEVAAGKLFEIEPENAGNHVLLLNLYAARRRWEEAAGMRKILKENGVRKEMGKSWVEVGGRVHVFVSGDCKLEGEMFVLSAWNYSLCDSHVLLDNYEFAGGAV